MELIAMLGFVYLFVTPSLLILQWYLCKKESTFASKLPFVVACFFILLGLYALIIAGLMGIIYYLMNNEKSKKNIMATEIKKMNINDL